MTLELEDMWTVDRSHYVLVKTTLGADETSYLIFDRRDRSAVVIEDDELFNEVVRQMLSASVEVLTELPE